MKTAKFLLRLLCALAALVLLAVAGFIGYVRIGARDYYAASEKAFRIPGLSEGVIGQALCYDREADAFLAAGYMKDGSASRVYVIDRAGGKIRKTLFLEDEAGAPLAAHCACMMQRGEWLYVTGDTACALYAFPAADILSLPDGGGLRCAGRFDPPALAGGKMRVDIVCEYDGCVALGEFYHPGEYATPESHHLTAPDGSERHALCLLFPEDENAALGIGETPKAAWSIPDIVQGIEIAGDRAYLSESWAVSLSACEAYDLGRLETQEGFTWYGEALPLRVFDSASLIKRVTLPPMSEQMAAAGDRLYTMCESASKKYLFGRLYGAVWCLSTKLETLAGK